MKTFHIDPLKLFDWNGGLYLSVRVAEHDAIRTLAVERIEKITLTENEFNIPMISIPM
jgi:predicted DNA-binding transcriptional regulator YafY